MSIVNYFNRLSQEVIFKLSCTGPVLDVTTQLHGAPQEFTGLTSNASTVPISKGNLNEIEFVPRIRNEHVGVFSSVQAVVDTNTTVGQIFQASKYNSRRGSILVRTAGY